MRLENYIMEQDINTASVADIFVEQAEAELNVAMSLLDATVKDLTFQEFAVYQEGELGTAVADARAEVRSDGKKHHIKAAFAAIKAFFKFLVTKVGSFFKKTETEAVATETTLNEVLEAVKSETGTDADIILPYSRNKFDQIVKFYSEMDSALDKVIDTASKLVDYIISNQNEFASGTRGNTVVYGTYSSTEKDNKGRPTPISGNTAMKRRAEGTLSAKHIGSHISDFENNADLKFLRSFIEKAKTISKLTAPDTFTEDLRALSAKVIANNAYGIKADYTKAEKKMMKQAAEKYGSDWKDEKKWKEYEHQFDAKSNEWVLVPKNTNTSYINQDDFKKFRDMITSAKDTWRNRQKEVDESIKTLNTFSNSLNGDSSATIAVANRAKSVLDQLSKAVAGIVEPANKVLSNIDKAARDARAKLMREHSAALRRKYGERPEGGYVKGREQAHKHATKSDNIMNGDNRTWEKEKEPLKIKVESEYYSDSNYEGSYFDELM